MQPPAPALDFDTAVAQIPFLQALSPEQLEQLRPHARLRRVAHRQAVWAEGNQASDFTFLCFGRAKLVRAGEAGRAAVVDLPMPGHLLCASAVSCSAPYCCSAASLDQAVDVLTLPREILLDLLGRSPEAARAFMQEMSGREMRLARRIGELSSGKLEQRIAHLLLRLAQECGSAAGAARVKIPLRLRRQDLADLCSARIETTIRTMRGLAQRDLVRSVPGGFLIDRPGLERLVRDPP